SRMSAYLHYGMVSPMRLAREAAAIDNAGSEKYLDELLIWRELAYSFCFHQGIFDPWSAIPEWAQETLQSHADDVRDSVYSWEELARAKTDDAFWNAAQLSLLRQGELHNNVRMTWGKAILNWTQSPKRALQFMIDLNHRYALDGRDPASYGGLLWCLGQFDRPFTPEQNIFGTVRPRATSDHAKRLDTEAYLSKVATPRFDPIPKVAVIGAGISGLFAARTLADHGLSVEVFDKGRSVGGRMSTRRIDGKPCFDHGAQYFTARDLRFQRYVDSWIEQGVVARWPDPASDPSQKIVVFKDGERTEKENANDRFVGVPGMAAVCKHLAEGLKVETSTRIEKIESDVSGGQINLTDDQGNCLGEFDSVIVSAPAAQAAELLVNFPKLAKPISNIQMQPCWAVMASFEEQLGDDWAGAFIHDSIVTWAARNSTKPQRPNDAEHLLLHAEHQWTAENWERDPSEVAEEVLAAFWESSAIGHQNPIHLQAHRWQFAIPSDPSKERCFFDVDPMIVACGDWAGGPRVEGAFLSGMAAAGRILGTLQPKQDPKPDQMKLNF
ncbi:FAD-dependent oxidoreductase, partial [bacterium]|nr:FAD-dependent oxidoreductase [bacterium]